ncbi:hypothetical protein D9619_002358 [Psilocybe cf. subviscida]|uniref:Uncharacterized protein n=1 Tax=Psilocybe cf. subviscida TaxID=2480587 RepID=A0A8H5AVU5_9AGAR|nr:hypothetical protein D9619_002358 [Psilocybe cf. subviscida]
MLLRSFSFLPSRSLSALPIQRIPKGRSLRRNNDTSRSNTLTKLARPLSAMASTDIASLETQIVGETVGFNELRLSGRSVHESKKTLSELKKALAMAKGAGNLEGEEGEERWSSSSSDNGWRGEDGGGC